MSDVEQIMGLVQAENIQVHAESYDVALDMSFPKGTFLYSASYKIASDGCLRSTAVRRCVQRVISSFD